MRQLRLISMVVTLILWAITFALAYYGVIPVWVAVLIAILVFFLGGSITLWILRHVLGWDNFTDLVVGVQSEQLEAHMTKEDQWKTDLLTEHRRLRSSVEQRRDWTGKGHRPAGGPGIRRGHLALGGEVINSGADDFPERSHLIQTQDAKCGHRRNSGGDECRNGHRNDHGLTFGGD
jgi:hypothetical protein